MILLYLFILLLSVLYFWIKHVYGYWSRTNFAYLKPSIPFGNVSNAALGRKAMGLNIYDLYQSTDEPIVGIHLIFRPALLVRDADLVKNMLTTDFSSFYNRGVYHNPSDPIADNILMLPGQEWKRIRSKVTPSFTSGMLKAMMPTVIRIGGNMKRILAVPAAKGNIVEVKDLVIRYALDVIGTVAFGLDVNTLDDENHSFREIERRVNNGEFINRIRLVGAFFCPKILEILRMSSLSDEFKEFMIEIVKNTMEYRESSNVTQKDLIQFLIDLRKTGKSSYGDTNEKDDMTPLTLEQCTAHVALFYLAGFDTTASAVSYCLFELSRQPDLMKRAQNEIDEVMEKYKNNITYESIKEMTFLDACVKETVRKYPTLPFLNRICTKAYNIPNTDLIVPEGIPIIISLFGMMRDPQNFPDPMKFMPDRFEDGNYIPSAFIPFGDGPHTCIGARMGQIVAKIALILLLQQYDFGCVIDRELEFENHSVTLVVKGGINLKITNRH